MAAIAEVASILAEMGVLRAEHAREREDYEHRLTMQRIEMSALRAQLSTAESVQRPNGSSRVPVWHLEARGLPARASADEHGRQLHELAERCASYAQEIGHLVSLQKMAAAERAELLAHNAALQRALDRVAAPCSAAPLARRGIAYAGMCMDAASAHRLRDIPAPTRCTDNGDERSGGEDDEGALLPGAVAQIWRATHDTRISLTRAPPTQRRRPLSAGASPRARGAPAASATCAANVRLATMPLTSVKQQAAHAPAQLSCELLARGAEVAQRARVVERRRGAHPIAVPLRAGVGPWLGGRSAADPPRVAALLDRDGGSAVWRAPWRAATSLAEHSAGESRPARISGAQQADVCGPGVCHAPAVDSNRTEGADSADVAAAAARRSVGRVADCLGQGGHADARTHNSSSTAQDAAQDAASVTMGAAPAADGELEREPGAAQPELFPRWVSLSAYGAAE
ncbi:hypothetical protein KFE25_002658 [Diacronema lutheri]|uniref:Uncharacterized protein n=1 Tax=Diacronema lutheri TaxID=2081491 RepID=A0A8J6CBR5_DIALT|nr:hypothetical protein KFE25_002658 [Diacronema lutheri]